MIYLCSDFEKIVGSLYSHEFYYDGKFYSHKIHDIEEYYVCDIDTDKEYNLCGKFDYILPAELNMVNYINFRQRLEILKKIVERKIFEKL